MGDLACLATVRNMARQVGAACGDGDITALFLGANRPCDIGRNDSLALGDMLACVVRLFTTLISAEYRGDTGVAVHSRIFQQATSMAEHVDFSQLHDDTFEVASIENDRNIRPWI